MENEGSRTRDLKKKPFDMLFEIMIMHEGKMESKGNRKKEIPSVQAQRERNENYLPHHSRNHSSQPMNPLSTKRLNE